MNILYVSCLNGDSWAGPTYSVPKQIEVQSKLDNVFWYNIRKSKLKEWKNISCYHDLDDYPNAEIASLPDPFKNPDLIVVEQFYGFAMKRILGEIIRSHIPYVIIPRGELTRSAQKRKSWKKMIANMLIFKRFAKKAAAIEYLTEQEKSDSGLQWNKKNIVIPNGITIPEEVKTDYCSSGIKCIAVGRIEPYHKGLDMLIEVCARIAEELRKASCTIDLFGPDYDGKVVELREQIKQFGISDIIQIHDGLYGQDKIKELLKSDVFLLTSRFEGHPMALIEALSFGLPCVITRGSNMKSEVEEYDAGWTAETNTESLKAALLNMLKENIRIPSKGKNATELAGQYKWETIALKTHKEYLEILDKVN